MGCVRQCRSAPQPYVSASRRPVDVAWITPYNKRMATTIRAATAADAGLILRFIRALAAYEREPDAVEATEEDLLRHGFGENPYYQCLIAEHDGQAVGFALYFYDYSTWLGRPGLYLEDVFVDPPFRGLGIGKALLQRLAGDCAGEGLRPHEVGGAGLESAGHRLLREPGRGVSGYVAECAGERGCAAEIRHLRYGRLRGRAVGLMTVVGCHSYSAGDLWRGLKPSSFHEA